MKKIVKWFLIIFIINATLSIGFIASTTLSVINNSLDGTGIRIIDLVTNDVSKDKKKLLENNMEQNSILQGKSAAKKVNSILSIFIPNTKIDISKMPKNPYPYPEVSTMSTTETQKSFEEGLKILEQSEAQNDAARKKGLTLTNSTN